MQDLGFRSMRVITEGLGYRGVSGWGAAGPRNSWRVEVDYTGPWQGFYNESFCEIFRNCAEPFHGFPLGMQC